LSSKFSYDKEAVEDDDDTVNDDNVDDEISHRTSFTVQPQNDGADTASTYQQQGDYLNDPENTQKPMKTLACELTTQKGPSFC
jgi:hypothetical protein